MHQTPHPIKQKEHRYNEDLPIEYDDDNYVTQDIRTLLSWDAPNRPFRQRKKAYFVNLLLILLTLEIILFLFSQYLLMLVVASLAFVAYAFATTPPDKITYRISTEGISMDDHFYLWQELYDFYFKKRNGVDLLHVRTKAYFPGELIMLLGEESRDRVRQSLLPFLPYREVVRPSFMEKTGDWLIKTFPLDDTHHA